MQEIFAFNDIFFSLSYGRDTLFAQPDQEMAPTHVAMNQSLKRSTIVYAALECQIAIMIFRVVFTDKENNAS